MYISEFKYLAVFQTKAAKSWVMSKTTPNLALFYNCENDGRSGRNLWTN